MNCEEFRRGLETAIENRIAPEFTEGRDHLKHCSRCRALSEDYHIIERAVEEWTAVDDAPDLSGRVLAMLANDREFIRPAQTSSPYLRFIPLLVGLSAVAALFLIVFLTQRPEQNRPDVAQTPREKDLNTAGPPPVELVNVIGDTKAAYHSFVDGVTEPLEPLKEAITGGFDQPEKLPAPEVSPQDRRPSLPKELVVFNDELNSSLGFLKKVFPSQPKSP